MTKKSSVLSALSIVLLLASCSTMQRTPSSVGSVNDVDKSLQASIETVKSPSFNTETCSSTLIKLQTQVTQLDWNSYSTADLNSSAALLIGEFWQLRSALHQRLPDMNKACILQVREIFHLLHDHQDYLGEFAYKISPLDPSKLDFEAGPVPIYDRKAFPPYFVREDLDDPQFQFHSGDLMLARGISFFSAIISQVSDNKSQFSHVVFLNEDSKTKKLNTIESYIGSGVASYEINYALKNENARLVVLRPKDARLGQAAAGFAMKYAAEHIPYDYSMNMNDFTHMSCVAVSRAAYDQASNGATMIPQYPADLELKNAKFVDSLGLKDGPLVTPDDLEVDPRFEMVLDWRDYRIIRDSRHKDAVLSEMIRWINDLGYNFHDDLKAIVAKDLFLPASKTPLWPALKKIPALSSIDPNLPGKTMAVMVELNDVGTLLLNTVIKADDDYIAKYGRPMTNAQLRTAINAFREQDLANYTSGKGPVTLHKNLRPDNVAVPAHEAHSEL